MKKIDQLNAQPETRHRPAQIWDGGWTDLLEFQRRDPRHQQFAADILLNPSRFQKHEQEWAKQVTT